MLQLLLENIFQLDETVIFANEERMVDASFLKYNYGFVRNTVIDVSLGMARRQSD